MLGEVVISRTLSGLGQDADPANATPGFVRLWGVGVGRGRYPTSLLREWERWDAEHGSENDSVAVFGDDQLYTVGEFGTEDGGGGRTQG